MKSTPLVRRTPLRSTAQLARSATIGRGRESSGRTGNSGASTGRSARKAASDAALRRVMPALRERADGFCEVTGQPLVDGATHAHHRRKRGGPELDTLGNLLLCNASAHLAVFPGSIHAEPARSKTLGWILPGGVDPTLARVLYRGRWVILGDDGTITDWPEN